MSRLYTPEQKRQRALLAKKYRKEAKERAEKFSQWQTLHSTPKLKRNIKRVSFTLPKFHCMSCGVEVQLVNSILGVKIVGWRSSPPKETLNHYVTPDRSVLQVPVVTEYVARPILRKGRICQSDECFKTLSEVIPEWQQAAHLPEHADHDPVGWGFSNQRDHDGEVRPSTKWMTRK